MSLSFPAALADIAEQVGTPAYVYDRTRIEANFRRLDQAFQDARATGHPTPVAHMRYSVKANGNLSVLRVLRELGSGFDVVSGGEMLRALHAGADPSSIVFAGVGKRDDELIAALDARVGWINVESAQELRVLSDLAAARGGHQRVALRINPNVDPHTHRYMATGKGTSKFGIEVDEALRLVAERERHPGVSIQGIHIHIGSMVSEIEPYVDAFHVALGIIERCRAMGARITTLDLGGGFGVAYQPGQAAAPVDAIARALVPLAERAELELLFEPGRAIVADAGVLLTRVLYTKTNGSVRYAIVDAAMNDLIRPALYGARHGVSMVSEVSAVSEVPSSQGDTADTIDTPDTILQPYSIVGPICESGDMLAEGALLPELQRGDLLAIHHCGAYGMSMASNYNTRARAAEVMLEGDRSWRVIRPREEIESLWLPEVQCLR